MEMPKKINNDMLAPCGINCIACEKYCNKEDPCPGCRINSPGKSKSTLKCKIKACFNSKKFKYCSRCSEYPCKLIKKQDKNYKKRYNISLIENYKNMEYMGINRFMLNEKERWSCPKCNGIISLQNKKCSKCNNELK